MLRQKSRIAGEVGTAQGKLSSDLGLKSLSRLDAQAEQSRWRGEHSARQAEIRSRLQEVTLLRFNRVGSGSR